MPANVQTYIGRQAAWHRLGTVTGRYMTWADILAHGGLDYDVFKSQLNDGLGRKVAAWGTFRWNHADKLAGRKDAAQFLGVVGADYKVIHHSTGFEVVDALMGEGAANGAHYETAGVLGNGEVVWGLADLGLSISVGDDKQKGYLLFCTSHDGSYSYWLRIAMERVVCQNTLNMALSERGRAAFRIRHTKNAGQRIADAHQVLSTLAEDAYSVEDKLNMLAQRRVTREHVVSLMDRLFPKTKTESGATGETVEVSSSRRDNILGDVLALYEANDGNAFPEQRGTAYNLLNAITEYADHVRSSSTSVTRAQTALFGSGDKLKTQAFTTLLELAKDMPVKPRPVVVSSFADIGLNVPEIEASR